MSVYRVLINPNNDQLGAISSQIYVVKKGDTLFSIADKFDTTTIVLALTNNMAETDPIYIGQRLLIPGGAGVALSNNLNQSLTASNSNKTDLTPKSSGQQNNSSWLNNQTTLIGVVAVVTILVLLKRD